jgi:hypothetical protein
MGSPIPFSNSVAYGIDTRTYFGSPAYKPVRPGCPNEVPKYLITDPAYLMGEEALARAKRSKAIQAGQRERTGARETNNRGDHIDTGDGVEGVVGDNGVGSEFYYQMFHPTVDRVRIKIPTAHIFGRRDKWLLHSKDLLRLCRQYMTTVFEHSWGHEVPWQVGEEICDVIETVIARALNE